MRAKAWVLAAVLAMTAIGVRAEESAWTMLANGIQQYQKKKYDRAAQYLQSALRADARCHDAYLYLGMIHEKKGQPKQAAAQYKRIRKDSPAYSLAMARLGHMALIAGDLETAETCFKVNAEAHPSTPSYLQLASVQLDRKRYPEATKSLAEAAKYSKGNLAVNELRARLFMETKRYKEALDEYTSIVKKIPIDNSARHLRATCLKKLNRADEARREWNRVIEKDPWHRGALRALLNEHEGDPTMAETVKEYRRRLRILKKAPPKVTRVSGSGSGDSPRKPRK